MTLAPIALFAFRRPDHLAKVIVGLQANPDAARSNLFVYCDAARGSDDAAAVSAVRSFARAITGFAAVEVVERPENFGLARSIIEGVGALCRRFGRVIVLEDDVVPTPYFLRYVNEALDRYRDDDRVMSVGCFTFDTPQTLPATFFLDIPDCWGWGVWQRSWDFFEPDGVKLYKALRDRDLLSAFDLDGAYPYAAMLKDQTLGRNASWAVRWYASVMLVGGLTLYPGSSVTANIGQDGSGTHGGGAPLRPKLAHAPIEVGAIAIEPSVLARRAWANALRRQQGGIAGRTMYALRSGIGRALKPWRLTSK